MYKHNGTPYITADDQCDDCRFYEKCPLIEFMTIPVVFVEEDIRVTCCVFYEKKRRHLQVVKEGILDG